MNKCYCGHEFTEKELTKSYSDRPRLMRDDFFIKCPDCGKILEVKSKIRRVEFRVCKWNTKKLNKNEN